MELPEDIDIDEVRKTETYKRLHSLRPVVDTETLDRSGSNAALGVFSLDLADNAMPPAFQKDCANMSLFATGFYSGVLYGISYAAEYGIPDFAKDAFEVKPPEVAQ